MASHGSCYLNILKIWTESGNWYTTCTASVNIGTEEYIEKKLYSPIVLCLNPRASEERNRDENQSCAKIACFHNRVNPLKLSPIITNFFF